MSFEHVLDTPVPSSEWRWHGMPGHLIVSTRCCFHLVTDIGGVRVSTIGCYHESGAPVDYEHRSPIGGGDDSLYETFVFRLSGSAADPPAAQSPCDWDELWGERYATEAEAEQGHLTTCLKVAELGGDPEAVTAGLR